MSSRNGLLDEILLCTTPLWRHPCGPNPIGLPHSPGSAVKYSASSGEGRNVAHGRTFFGQPPLLAAAPSLDLLIHRRCARASLPGNANQDLGWQRQSCCHLGTAAGDALEKGRGGGLSRERAACTLLFPWRPQKNRQRKGC